MNKRNTFFAAAILLFGLGSYAIACDGYRQVERKHKRYDRVDLTSAQKKALQKLKSEAITGFQHDHKKMGHCDEHHKVTLTKFQTHADGVLTNVQRMELRTTERLDSLSKEVRELKSEIRELKSLVRQLVKQKSKR